ncbi:MAG: hypothetical protein QXN59_03305 [Candidatus Micrarchaeaceae archaeon]
MDYMEAKAPGKVLWLGGYSILERSNVGFVTTIDAYVHATSKLLEANHDIRISVPDFSFNRIGAIDKDTGRLNIDRPKELNLLVTTIEVAHAYALSKGKHLEGLYISTKNDRAFSYDSGGRSKSGMGSSSAVVVATVASILSSYNLDLYENDALHKLSQLSHSLATGKIGSGFDIAAATFGSIKYSRYNPDILKDFPHDYTPEDIKKIINAKWDYKIEKLSLPKIFSTLMANFVGGAAITTEMVGKVNNFKKENPDRYYSLINAMNKHVVAALEALEKLNMGEEVEYNLKRFKDEFTKNRQYLKQLGIESKTDIEDDYATELINNSEKNGAFLAKLPGSGGRDSIVALTLGGEKEKSKLRDYWSKNKSLDILDVNMANTGVQVPTKIE